MATVRQLLISIVTCSKCGKIVENERTYVNDEMFCLSCSENLDNTLKRLVKSQIWSTLCQCTKELLQDINDKPIQEADAAETIDDIDLTVGDLSKTMVTKPSDVLIHNDSLDVSDNNGQGIDKIDINLNITPGKSLEIELSDDTKKMAMEAPCKDKLNIDNGKLVGENVNIAQSMDESVCSNDTLIVKALKYFFNTQPGSLIIQKHTNGDNSQLHSYVSNYSQIKSYESVMQKEMEYFFNSEKGKILIKSVIADELKSLAYQQTCSTNLPAKKHDNYSTVNSERIIIDDPEYDSDNDMFVPPTPPVSNNINNETSKISNIMATSISLETRTVISKFAQYFNLKIYNSLFDDTDCLISDELIFTQKWLYARCKGFPIVKSTWMEDCLNSGKMLPMVDYLFQPQFQVPSIFKTLDIILCPPFSELSDIEYLKLWSMAGARVSLPNDWLPGPEHLKRVIVFDVLSLDLSPDEMKSMIMFHRAPAVTKSYLLTMLTYGTVDPIENHLYDIFLLNVPELKRMGFPCSDDLVME